MNQLSAQTLLEDVSPSEFIKGTDESVTAAENADGGSGIVEQIFCCDGDNKARQPLIQADSWHVGRTQKPDSVVCGWGGGGWRRSTTVDGGENK